MDDAVYRRWLAALCREVAAAMHVPTLIRVTLRGTADSDHVRAARASGRQFVCESVRRPVDPSDAWIFGRWFERRRSLRKALGAA